MATYNVVLLFIMSLVLALIISFVCVATEIGNKNDKLYIVYMGSLSKGVPYFPTSVHRNLLQQVLAGSDIENRLVRSYKRSFNCWSKP
ncbi:hypothetical protein MtrunA17_Chr3g0097071 [Medicago truncatula]|uniref:Subtilisin-like serine protease n=1 Tax=Medicago truncatula TaxID=3880 RepID=A0A072V6G6_MEDTR|nr:subtilisin-like serine protease [Medicago truncatula]KEH33760.1 subtilisin-like serine protease [Medicago truncatula]RHN66921.1 hypothetical protein MtrunA17_Chr3g0097071 [Medicago truncatula]